MVTEEIIGEGVGWGKGFVSLVSASLWLLGLSRGKG